MKKIVGTLFPYSPPSLRTAAGAGVLGFPVLPGKPRAPQAPDCVYSGADATPADLRRRCRKPLQTGNTFGLPV